MIRQVGKWCSGDRIGGGDSENAWSGWWKGCAGHLPFRRRERRKAKGCGGWGFIAGWAKHIVGKFRPGFKEFSEMEGLEAEIKPFVSERKPIRWVSPDSQPSRKPRPPAC